MRKYYDGLDLGKFIAALLVISIHTDPFGSVKGTMIFEVWEVIAALAVPFFFLCTGLFVGQSMQKSGTAIIWKRVLSFAKLYTMWTIAYLPLTIYSYFVHKKGIANDLFCFFRGLLVWGNHDWSWQLWYLLCAVYSLAFFYLLKKFEVDDRLIWGIVIVLYIVGSFLSYLVDGGENAFSKADLVASMVKKTIQSGRMLTGPLCLWIGMNISKFKAPQKAVLIITTVVGIVISIFTNGFIASLIRPFVVTAILLLTIDLAVGHWADKLHFRSASSYIYYIHMYFVFLTNYVMKLKGMPRFLLTMLLTLAVVYGFIFFKNLYENGRLSRGRHV